MKKKFFLACVLACFLILLAACKTITIPNSSRAKEKLQNMGYSVQVEVTYGEDAARAGIEQVTVLTADRGEDFIQVYFFTNEQDAKTLYRDHAASLTRGVEVVKKNKYSIYRGSQTAVDDFLSEDISEPQNSD